jgi:hypothetical protein
VALQNVNATTAHRHALHARRVAQKALFRAGIAMLVVGLAVAVLGSTWEIVKMEWFGVLSMDEVPGLDWTGWGCVIAGGAAFLLLMAQLGNVVRNRLHANYKTWSWAGVLGSVIFWCAAPAFHVIRERYFEGPLSPSTRRFLSTVFYPVEPTLKLVRFVIPESHGLYVYLYVAHVLLAIVVCSAGWSAVVIAAHRLAQHGKA